MSGASLADRLRANLAAAGIPATSDDVERVLADGTLERAERHVDAIRAADDGAVPDYLGLWAPDAEPMSEATEASASGGSSAAPDVQTIASVAPLVREGRVSPVELTERSLGRIEDRDGELNAFQLVLIERAMDAARRAEGEIARGDWRGPLHGVPVAVKDLLAMTATVTTAGSRMLAESVTDYDATAIERLESAGAIIVGKTRLPEFAFWPGSTNPHFGPTANPRDVTRDSGGSSSGSGAAVGDGMVFAALGTDTGGSIRIPAALCGVVGLKPTYGRVSLFGCAPLAWSLDHLGPLTRSVEDAALVLAALAGRDPRDPRTRSGTTFEAREIHGGVAGLRVGVPTPDHSRRAFGSEAAVRAWRTSNRCLADAGATLVEVELADMTLLRAASFLILSTEAASFHAEKLRNSYDLYGELCRDRLLAGFAYSARDVLQAQRFRGVARRAWRELFTRIDVLSTPAQPDVAPPLGEAGSTRFTNAFNALGLPAVTVPFGLGEHGLPLATQLVGRPWEEATILRAALVLETART